MYICFFLGNKIKTWQEYDSTKAVKLGGLHMMGSAYYILRMVRVQGTIQGLYAVLLRVENV